MRAAISLHKARKCVQILRKVRWLAFRTLGRNSAQYEQYNDMHDTAAKGMRSTCQWIGAASKHAKRVFFDKIIVHAHPQLVSNYVAWTRPRWLDSSVQIKRADGTVIDSQEDLKMEFREQFTPLAPWRVDMSIMDELPQWETCTFNDISNEEVSENLADMSNTLVGGEDHIS